MCRSLLKIAHGARDGSVSATKASRKLCRARIFGSPNASATATAPKVAIRTTTEITRSCSCRQTIETGGCRSVRDAPHHRRRRGSRKSALSIASTVPTAMNQPTSRRKTLGTTVRLTKPNNGCETGCRNHTGRPSPGPALSRSPTAADMPIQVDTVARCEHKHNDWDRDARHTHLDSRATRRVRASTGSAPVTPLVRSNPPISERVMNDSIMSTIARAIRPITRSSLIAIVVAKVLENSRRRRSELSTFRRSWTKDSPRNRSHRNPGMQSRESSAWPSAEMNSL